MPQLKQNPWPGGTLPAILEPWIWVATIEPSWIQAAGDTIRITGIVKGPEAVGDTGADIDSLIGTGHQRLIDGLGRATRETMYRRAEEAIAAALEAGFTLARHPEISVSGSINRDRDTGIDVPCAEMRADLCFRPPTGG